MWNKPSEKWLATVPSLPFEGDTYNKKVYMHFFFGGSDWYVMEYDPDRREFFGYVILNGDTQNSEYGFFSFDELIEINKNGFEIDCDTSYYKKPRYIRDIPALAHLIN